MLQFCDVESLPNYINYHKNGKYGFKIKNGIELSLFRMKNKDNNARRGIAREYPEML